MPVDVKWFRNRVTEMGLTQRSLAKQIGRDYAAVSKLVNGKRRMTADEAAIIARALNVTVEEVLQRFGSMPSRGKRENVPGVPIVGSIGEGAKITLDPDEPQNYAQRPGAGEDLAALIWHRAAGTDQNWAVYYRPTGTVDPEAIGALSIAALSPDQIVLCQLRRGYIAEHYNIIAWDGAGTLHENVKVQWAAPVLWMHP